MNRPQWTLCEAHDSTEIQYDYNQEAKWKERERKAIDWKESAWINTTNIFWLNNDFVFQSMLANKKHQEDQQHNDQQHSADS